MKCFSNMGICGEKNVEKGSSGIVQLDEALSMAKFGKFNIFLITMCGVNLAAVLLETLGISFVVPVAQCDLKLTIIDKGILSAIGFLGIITSSHLWGFLADTVGRRRVILPSLIVAFCCSAISSLLNNFAVFVLFRFLNGFFISGSSATIFAFLSEFHTSKTRSRAIMGASTIFGLAGVLMPAIAFAILRDSWQLYIPFLDLVFKPWRLLLIVLSLPTLSCALYMLQVPESPKFVLSQGREQEAIKIVQSIYAKNTGKPMEQLEIVKLQLEEDDTSLNAPKSENAASEGFFRRMWSQTAPMFRAVHLKKTMIACTIQFGMFATSNGMYMFFPDILNRIATFQNIHNSTAISATLCTAVYGTRIDPSRLELTDMVEANNSVCSESLDNSTFLYSMILELLYATGFAFIGTVINSVGKKLIVLIVLFVCGICGIGVVYVLDLVLASYLYVMLLLCGLAITVVNAMTVDLYPTNLRAMAICISLMMGRLGSVVGSNLVALTLETYCEATFWVSGTSLIACGLFAYLIPKPTEPPKDNSDAISITSRGQ